MMHKKTHILGFLAALAGSAVASACTGGGGGGSIALPPHPSPSPIATAALPGTLQVASGGTFPSYTYSAAAGASVVFSCGCSLQAGSATTTASGTFTLVAQSTPTPSAPNPTYTIVPGRNYLIVGTTGAAGSSPEAWDIQYAGNNPSRDLFLNGTNTSDVYTAAVGLYVYFNSPPGVLAYDNWNFNTLVSWYNVLSGSPNAKEATLLNDIAAQSVANRTLYPAPPAWDPSHVINTTIKTDLNAVKTSGDPALPTPCPSTGCTNAPSP